MGIEGSGGGNGASNETRRPNAGVIGLLLGQESPGRSLMRTCVLS